MKFITATHLEQWANTKECQNYLSGLIEKLITASIPICNIDALSFPSGDKTCLPGWDGIAYCQEKIDLVPEGRSFWEFGADKNVRKKIESDFKKRNDNQLGYNKSSSTFVFVTPRTWTEKNKWKKEHQKDGWKKIVIYTAVELERWIEQRPSVGIWLAKKLNILPSKGFELPETYWNKWLPWRDTQLPYEIILHGREEISEQVVKTSKNFQFLILQALTPQEGIAFAIASLLTCKDAEKLKSKIIVATEKDAFEDLIEHYNNLIIITDVTQNLHHAVQHGHSVIAVTTLDSKTDKSIELPRIKKEGFLKSLIKLGFNEAEAYEIAKYTACDINIFRRKYSIEINKPAWAEPHTLSELLPAFLVGKWTATKEGDQNILEKLSGMSYDKYELVIQAHRLGKEAPLIRIGNMWRVRSSYEAMLYAEEMLTDSLLDKYENICLDLIQDYDHDILNTLKNHRVPHWISEQKYSQNIKEGVFQNLHLIPFFAKDEHNRFRNRTRKIVDLLFSNWNLAKFLSNKLYIPELAKASPKSFLNFIKNLPEEMLQAIFECQKFDMPIYYLEVLNTLESLAWDREHLNRVTELLLRFSEYKNESNWKNRPLNSLLSIYRLFEPQTKVSFEDRLAVLESKYSRHKSAIYRLCKSICQSLCEEIWPYHANLGYLRELKKIVELMLKCCDYSAEEINDLITLSLNIFMSSCRSLIINSLKPHLAQLDEKQNVIDGLKHLLRQQQVSQRTDLKPYQDLLNEFELKDPLHRNTWLFTSFHLSLPDQTNPYCDKAHQDLLEVRKGAISKITKSCGNEAIWDFIKIVKDPASVAESLVSLYGSDLINDVCQKYKSKEINENFTKPYLSQLCRKDVKRYQMLAKDIFESDKDLGIVLWAPDYVKELAELAANFGDSVKRSYWSSLNAICCFANENAAEIARELINVGRYHDAVQVIYLNKNATTDLEIAQILYDCAQEAVKQNLQLDSHIIVELVEDLDRSEDPEVIRLVKDIEFLLYDKLWAFMHITKSRFIKAVTLEPDSMMKLIELVYRPDDDKDQQSKPENLAFVKIAFYILHSACRLVPRDNDGNIDETCLYRYIEKLRSLAKEKKRINATDRVVGFILGDIPLNDKYPPKYLCEIVGDLDSDIINKAIQTRILQNCRVFAHLCNEGGDQERGLAAKFEEYKEKVELLYPRMADIFSAIIEDYKNEAERRDEDAEIYDLEY